MPAFRSFVPDPSSLGEKVSLRTQGRPGSDTTVTGVRASPSTQVEPHTSGCWPDKAQVGPPVATPSD